MNITDTMAYINEKISNDNSLRAFLAALAQAARDGRLEGQDEQG